MNVSDLPRTHAIKVAEKPMATGNGKATYKTATAAANAAREARDEAKKAAEASRVHQIECDNAKALCKLCAESAIYTCKRDRWWKILIVVMILVELFVQLMT
jgi:hypothetical protein